MTVLIWTGLTIALYGQFIVIKHLRHNLISVASHQRGMHSAQMMEHELLQICRLSHFAIRPVSGSCHCENGDGNFLDHTLFLTPDL